MHNRILSVAFLCLISASLFLVTVAAAGSIVDNMQVIPKSIDPDERNNPENIAALKTHIAYVGASQEARMDGVIDYIGNISGNAGIDRLRQIRDDYLSAAATIPIMQTADDINALRNDMVVQSRLFAEEARVQMQLFNGTPEGMQQTADLSMQAFDLSMNSMSSPLWLSRESARIRIFSKESQERNLTLTSLSGKGIDITEARRISEEIDAKRSDLEDALHTQQGVAMARANTGIKALNQQFRNTVGNYRETLEIQMKVAAINAVSM